MKIHKPLFILLAIAILQGCSTFAYLETDDVKTAGEVTNSEQIKVYVSDSSIEGEYDILGTVVVASDAGSNSSSVVTLLKKQAAQLGADSIIDLRIEYEYGYWSIALKATGTAIKSK